MPWVVGIDEAGYGPNLGPLVQAAVALKLPDADPAGWDTVAPVVRRAKGRADGRLMVDDSKKVYARGGLAALERGVWGGLGASFATVDELLTAFALAGIHDDLRAEGWFDGSHPLPLHPEPVPDVWDALAALGVHAGCAAASLVPAPLFNAVCDGSGTKSTVLACGLVALLAAADARLADAEPVLVLCDKQGGRNFYAGLIQQAFPTGWVVAEVEGLEESRYRVERLARPMTIVFRPRADAESVAVALASMLCKYLREVCMLQFNRFWEQHVPGIRPTAGYPVDAKRFYAEIRPAMAALGLAHDQVWRKK